MTRQPEFPDKKELSRNRNCAIGAAILVAGYLVAFAGDGLFSYFTPDDMMNLYGAWFRPLIEAERPLGALFYRAFFAAFGWNPFPYRAACLLLLLTNLALLYAFCSRLTHSREIAGLACLLGAYHAHLADLYYSTGTVYDLLCGVLYMAAFVYYTGVRQRGEPRGSQIVFFLLLYLSALSAKQMAITLPLIVLLYDLLYHPPQRGWLALRRWALREARVLGPAAFVTVVFILFEVAGPGKITDNPDYLPHLAWSTFMAAWQHYCFDLFYGVVAFNQARIVLLWVLLVGIAALLRRRALIFAFLFLFVTILPVAFITPRGFFAIYLTLPGWYLFAAAALAAGRDAITRRFHSLRFDAAKTATQAALFLVVALALLPLHWRQKPMGKQWVASAHATVRAVVEHLQEVAGPLPRGARVLFLSDPYPKDEWMLTFIFRLHYRDEEIHVDRARAMRIFPDAAAQATYDRIFVTDGRTLSVVPAPAPRPPL